MITRRQFSDDSYYCGPSGPSAPLVRKPAPDFSSKAVINGEIKNIELSDYKGKYLVLFFYPMDFTFVCPTEILAFSDRAGEFQKVGAEVAAVSVDSAFSHLAWTKVSRKEGGLGQNLNIPLIADFTKSISSNYGVLTPDDDAVPGVALRGLFIIDPKGIVRVAQVNDLPIGRSVNETLRLLQAIQHNDKHGEVCPAEWTPGKDAMKGDPKGSKSYFNKHGRE